VASYREVGKEDPSYGMGERTVRRAKVDDRSVAAIRLSGTLGRWLLDRN
jgi:hypothetical protein